MRWFWIDRITHMEKGKTARAVKNVSLAEEHVHDHFPHYPIMPQTLMIEGMAQTGGILAGSVDDFRQDIILAKISRATFHRLLRPGDQGVYEAELVGSSPEGHRAEVRITVEGELVAEASLMFANYDSGNEDRETFVFTDALMSLLAECPDFEMPASAGGGSDE